MLGQGVGGRKAANKFITHREPHLIKHYLVNLQKFEQQRPQYTLKILPAFSRHPDWHAEQASIDATKCDDHTATLTSDAGAQYLSQFVTTVVAEPLPIVC